jgi:hypothetical protein
MRKWLSRKLAVVLLGTGLFSFLPILYKQVGVSDPVSLVALGALTSLLGYYLKINKDSKAFESVNSGTDS